MSCVAEQKAVIVKSISAIVNHPRGANNAKRSTVTAITNCIDSTHHRLVRSTSTNGLHKGLITQGNAISDVKSAISALGIPNCVNSVTLTLVTRK